MVKIGDALPNYVKKGAQNEFLNRAHGEAILRNDGDIRRMCARAMGAEMRGEKPDANELRAIEHFMVTIKEAA